MRVYAGGDHSFLLVNGDKTMCTDFRVSEHNKQVLALNIAKLSACEVFKDADVVSQVCVAYVMNQYYHQYLFF